MWAILEDRRVGKRFGCLPVEILKRYEKWKDVVAISGPAGLRLIKGFHDEALESRWHGHRSSRLSRKYRVIHRVISGEGLVEVIDVTAHDYKTG